MRSWLRVAKGILFFYPVSVLGSSIQSHVLYFYSPKCECINVFFCSRICLHSEETLGLLLDIRKEAQNASLVLDSERKICRVQTAYVR